MPGQGQLLRPRSKKSIGSIDKDHAEREGRSQDPRVQLTSEQNCRQLARSLEAHTEEDAKQKRTYDLVVTNVQRVPYKTSFDKLTVKALWGPSALNGIEGEQAVGVATVNGTLCLVHTSYTPLNSLLETSMQILMTACEKAIILGNQDPCRPDFRS